MSDFARVIKDQRTFRILIVDDKPSMRKTLRNMLGILEFQAFGEAEDGEAAYDRLINEKYDFILCDWNMPVMNGQELLAKVRHDDQLKHLPFLMVTAEVEEGTVARVIETNVDGYIIKPFVPQVLQEKMLEILSRKYDPPAMDTQLEQAAAWLADGHYDQAHAELNNLEKQHPRNPKLHYTRGLIFLEQGDWLQAEKSFLKAREAGPRFIKAYEKLAEVYDRLGQVREKVKIIEEAVRISPKNPDRQFSLGQALLETGRTEDARKAFEAAVRCDPGNPARKTAIGQAYLSKGFVVEAESVFISAIEDFPLEIDNYNRLGMAYRQQKKYLEAIENYRRALAMEPEAENLHFNLARAYRDAGQDSAAVQTLHQALKISPDFHEARKLLDQIQRT